MIGSLTSAVVHHINLLVRILHLSQNPPPVACIIARQHAGSHACSLFVVPGLPMHPFPLQPDAFTIASKSPLSTHRPSSPYPGVYLGHY